MPIRTALLLAAQRRSHSSQKPPTTGQAKAFVPSEKPTKAIRQWKIGSAGQLGASFRVRYNTLPRHLLALALATRNLAEKPKIDAVPQTSLSSHAPGTTAECIGEELWALFLLVRLMNQDSMQKDRDKPSLRALKTQITSNFLSMSLTEA